MKKLYERGFLNKNEGTAFYEIAASIDDYQGEVGSSRNICADLKIGDCNRVVNLEFSSWDSRSDARERIKKLNKLIDALNTLKTWLVAASR